MPRKRLLFYATMYYKAFLFCSIWGCTTLIKLDTICVYKSRERLVQIFFGQPQIGAPLQVVRCARGNLRFTPPVPSSQCLQDSSLMNAFGVWTILSLQQSMDPWTQLELSPLKFNSKQIENSIPSRLMSTANQFVL